jgi:hypothetical protein
VIFLVFLELSFFVEKQLNHPTLRAGSVVILNMARKCSMFCRMKKAPQKASEDRPQVGFELDQCAFV